MPLTPFAYVNAEKSPLYRAIMRTFVAAKERFLVHLRPEDVHEHLHESARAAMEGEEVGRALQQLVDWGNLRAEPDTGRVTTVEDFYRARYLFQLTKEGEAAEIALAAYDEALGKRGALQAVALEDIRHQLRALRGLLGEASPDPARVHFLLRDLSRVFADLAENAQAFMAGLGRTLELRGADREAFLAYKDRLIDYLQRFIGELVTASADIARLIREIGEGGGSEQAIDTLSGDGSLRISLTPLGPETCARIETPDGGFGGRDHLLCIDDLEEENEEVGDELPRQATGGRR